MNMFKSKKVSKFLISLVLTFIMVISSVPQTQAAVRIRYVSARYYITYKEDLSVTSTNLSSMLKKYYAKAGSGSLYSPKVTKGTIVNNYIITVPSLDNYLDDNQYVEWNQTVKSRTNMWYVLGNIVTIPDENINSEDDENGENIEITGSEEPLDTQNPDSTSASTSSDQTPSTADNQIEGNTSSTGISTTTGTTDTSTTTETTTVAGATTTSGTTTTINGFVHTKGTKYYDESGKEYILKGMNFGNYMWYNPTTPQTWYCDESSYKELAEAGFNTIRFYLNYALLEDDNNPYVYKQSGLEWLDKNVAWAEKYGIKILFNMHIPQGSKDVDSWDIPNGSLYLFAGNEATENRARLKAMWVYLANRYKNSKGVIGYGLLNEPKVAYTGSIESSKATWESYAQELASAIRTVDNNHILFVEPTTSIIDVNNGNMDMVFEYSESLFTINDSNYAVEFHYYYPLEFTHQATNTAYAIGSSVYPNYDEVAVSNQSWYTNIYYSNSYNYSTGDWQYVESPAYKVTSLSDCNAAYATLRTNGLGNNSYAYFDNMMVTAYDENGNYVATVKDYNFNDCNDYLITDSFYNNNAYYSYTDGIGGSGCAVMRNESGEFTVSASNSYKFFALKEGYSYKISAYVKVIGATTTNQITPTISFIKANSVYAIDKAYLKDKVELYTKFMTNNNVPLYMGEYGTFIGTFAYGGNQWVSDMLDIINEKGLSASFHEYKPGLYTTYDMNSTAGVRNDTLYNIFKEKQTK